MVFAASPVSGALWDASRFPSVHAADEVDTGEEVERYTFERASSFVVHEIDAPVGVMLPTAILEMTGAVTSPSGMVMNDPCADEDVLFAASVA